MTRRRLLLLSALALVLLAGAWWLTDALIPPVPGVTAANVGRILPGMTLEEVNTLMGKPPIFGAAQPPDFKETVRAWSGMLGVAFVTFGGDGRVQSAEWDWGKNQPNVFDRVRWWVGW